MTAGVPAVSPGLWPSWLALLAGVLVSSSVGAADYSTINRNRLRGFTAAMEDAGRPATVISFGDSMADSYRSTTFHVMNRLVERFGVAGYSLQNYRNTLLPQLAGGAFIQRTGEHWFSAYFGVPQGGSLWWDNQPNPGGVLCDTLGVFYVLHPLGGEMRVSVSTNGGPWTIHQTLDGFSESPKSAFASLDVDLDRYRIRVDGVNGMNYIIGPHALDSQAGGLHAVYVDYPGIHLGQVVDVPVAIRDPVISGLRPDLIIWHMKENVDALLESRMRENEAWWRRAAPDCEILYIGTPWVGSEIGADLTLGQNAIVRSIALEHDRAYVDLMQPTFSYDWLLQNDYMADETHLNSAGGLHTADLLWKDSGFLPREPNEPSPFPRKRTGSGSITRLQTGPPIVSKNPWT